MNGIDKRVFKSRVDSKNLVAYSCLDDSGKIVTKQGMGRTLNVSEGGILLEIHSSIPTGSLLSLSIGFEEDVCDILARVVYVLAGDNGMFKCGMSFQDVNDETGIVLKKFIDYFMGKPGKIE